MPPYAGEKSVSIRGYTFGAFMAYETAIGVETRAQLKTKSKMWRVARTNSAFYNSSRVAILPAKPWDIPVNETYFLLMLLAVAPILIIVQVYLLVLKMSEPEKMLQPIPGGLNALRQQVLLDHRDWFSARGLEYLTSFQFGKIQVAVFKQQTASRYFCFNFMQSWSYDLITSFDETNGLTTSSSNGIGMFPMPSGDFKQGFPNATADEIWQRHLEAEEYLARKFGLAPRPLTMTYEQHVIDGIRKQMAYVRSIPLWPIRSLYWFAVTRSRMANRSIQQQFP